jgi:hypothetical protein
MLWRAEVEPAWPECTSPPATDITFAQIDASLAWIEIASAPPNEAVFHERRWTGHAQALRCSEI